MAAIEREALYIASYLALSRDQISYRRRKDDYKAMLKAMPNVPARTVTKHERSRQPHKRLPN